MVFTLRSSYDSSELFNTKEQPYPLFRSLTNWDVNLWKKFWEFWKVIMTPDDADNDIAAAVHSTQATAVLPFDFDTYNVQYLQKWSTGRKWISHASRRWCVSTCAFTC